MADQVLGSFLFSNQVTGALIIIAKTIARKNNNTALITVYMNQTNKTTAVPKEKAFISEIVRLLGEPFCIVEKI
jgi:hypothetical protein